MSIAMHKQGKQSMEKKWCLPSACQGQKTMKKLILIALTLSFNLGCVAQDKARVPGQGSRTVISLDKHWQFIRQEVPDGEKPDTDTAGWETVSVPHDWAIKGPFDKEIDRQVVRVTQDLEKVAKERTGRTGALPHIGVGWYRKTFTLAHFRQGKKALLVFDGAMSDAHVFVNGMEVGNWPFGYNYFYFDISEYLKDGENLLAVRLENLPFSSRWYPGAGLFRKVQIIVKDEVSLKQWGVFVTTPFVSE